MKTPVLILAALAAVVLLILGLRFNRALAAGAQEPAATDADSFYDLSTRTLAGEPADLGRYRGQVALVVNTASKCGLTPQYAGLQALYVELAPRGFVVLGFPSNDFMGQEPGTPQEIQVVLRHELPRHLPALREGEGQGRRPRRDLPLAHARSRGADLELHQVPRRPRRPRRSHASVRRPPRTTPTCARGSTTR